jgi:hypothetical protein
MGAKEGSIIATIITVHMPMNDAATLAHVCPHRGVHAIDIDQPPGIGISPIADIDEHQTIVNAELTAKSSAETPKKPWLETLCGDIFPPSLLACPRHSVLFRRPSTAVLD